MNDVVTVPGWPTPKGYANGRVGSSYCRVLYVAGQIGWTPQGVFEAKDLVGQFAQALSNVVAVVKAAGGVVTDITSMTVYVTDVVAYRAATKELGPVWKQWMGKHYPAMALVAVSALVEPDAVVEIQAIAHLEPTETE